MNRNHVSILIKDLTSLLVEIGEFVLPCFARDIFRLVACTLLKLQSISNPEVHIPHGLLQDPETTKLLSTRLQRPEAYVNATSFEGENVSKAKALKVWFLDGDINNENYHKNKQKPREPQDERGEENPGSQEDSREMNSNDNQNKPNFQKRSIKNGQKTEKITISQIIALKRSDRLCVCAHACNFKTNCLPNIFSGSQTAFGPFFCAPYMVVV